MDADRMISLLQQLIADTVLPEPGWVTAREIANSEGRYDLLKSERHKLRQLVASGIVEMKMVCRVDTSGRMYQCPGYRVGIPSA